MSDISATERRILATTYAAGVRETLAPAQARGLAAGASAADLLPVSRALATAAGAGLAAADPLEAAAAEVQLLAGAALDLAMAGQLAGPVAPQVRGYAAELTDVGPGILLPDLNELQTLIAAPEAYLMGSVAGHGARALAGRGTRALAEPAAELADAVHTALASIRGDVVATGSHTIEGLLLLDAALLREAISAVGGDVASKLGLDLGGISARAAQFLLAANEKILALLGLDAMSEARKQLDRWLTQLRAGALFPNLADRILRTRTTETEIKRWLAAYQGTESGLLLGRDEVTQLAGRFAAKMRVADKVTAGLAVAKVIPPLMTPAGRIAVAAVYLGLLAYVVGSGYDHVDSDRIKLLDRVEGVRGVSKRVLGG